MADLTGLDVLGLPVVQAIRPWSRALSVHQGKGFDYAAAAIGAAMEAVESCSAEAFDGEARIAAFATLSQAERSAAHDDFADRRDGVTSDQAIAWTPARRLSGVGVVWTPWWGVSLDATRFGEAQVERTSNGLAAAFDRPRAMLTAVCEVLERDALVEWQALRPHVRTASALDLDTIDLDTFKALRRRTREASMTVTIYLVRAAIGWPVVMCEIFDPAAWPAPRHHVSGSACRPRASDALEAAMLEAVQTRLTFISAARDDILPEAYMPRRTGLGAAFPLPPGKVGLSWSDVVAGDETDAAPTVELAAERLARVGYPQAATVDIACPAPEAVVVKAVVPGLGTFGRRRRAPSSP